MSLTSTYVALGIAATILVFISGMLANWFDAPDWLEDRTWLKLTLAFITIISLFALNSRLDDLKEEQAAQEAKERQFSEQRLQWWQEPASGIKIGYPAGWAAPKYRIFAYSDAGYAAETTDPKSLGTALISIRIQKKDARSERQTLAGDATLIRNESVVKVPFATTAKDPRSGKRSSQALSINSKKFEWTRTTPSGVTQGITVFVPAGSDEWCRIEASAPIQTFEQYHITFERVFLSLHRA